MRGTVGLVLAAGASTRMGTPKALLPAGGGESYVGRAVGTLLSGGAREVLVVVGAGARAIATALPAGATPVRNRRWRSGQLSSARVGLRAALARGASRIVLSLVDHPALSPGTVRLVLASRSPAAAPEVGGEQGHPLVLSRASAAAILRVRGAGSLREALARAGITPVPVRVRDAGALGNVNTPAAHRGFRVASRRG